ncbi:NUDIX hydrolase [Actinomadura sp. GC306]|uniref:NUDIX domain-containing protein n=1 Tax=Actinomadura sp. GC306 TaxID=2530367 RepID=UPI00104A1DFA|nr:NUDIX hydrolase [Actinomadura sp. GC306]TDC71472.1 NUDIX hydrolase [Actinomadura sp. GC306]
MPEREEPAVRRVGTRVVYENPWMIVREDAVERPDGSRGIYGVVDKPDFVLVIPVERDGFHLVEEYRYPIGRRTWSFPQGSLPGRQDADPEELARLELAQETGLRAGALRHLGYLNCSHGTSGQGFNIFVASDLTAGEPDREPEEQDMRQKWVSGAEFRALVREGRITDDSTLAAYALLLMDAAAGEAPITGDRTS